MTRPESAEWLQLLGNLQFCMSVLQHLQHPQRLSSKNLRLLVSALVYGSLGTALQTASLIPGTSTLVESKHDPLFTPSTKLSSNQ
jgi:hypothetical protein